MRRRISLYIGDQLADINDQTFVLFNYTQEDVTNPAGVQNGYSKQVTLPGTDNNNRIFGHAFRLDRVPQLSATERTGIYFVPHLRTPFTIYDEKGTILESGYLKLDKVVKTRGKVEYAVTLFSGLGSFLYGLSYDANGNKRTLADLDYLGTGSPETEFDFAINAAAVQDAWDELQQSTPSGMWSVINFAPCYNGIPEGQFSADKGIFIPSGAGLADNVGSYSTSYTNGYALASLPRKFDEWEVKDLRSYLQRPVVNVEKVLRAIADSGNNGGWTVSLPAIEDNTYEWKDLWMTLPLLPNLGTYRQTTGSLSRVLNSVASQGPTIGTYTISGNTSLPTGSAVKMTLNVLPQVLKGAYAGTTLSQILHANFYSIAFIQLVALDQNSVAIGGSEIHCLYGGPAAQKFATVQDAALPFNVLPAYQSANAWDGTVYEEDWSLNGTVFEYDKSLPFNIDVADGSSVRTVEVRMWAFMYHRVGSSVIDSISGGDAQIRLNDGTGDLVATGTKCATGSGSDSLVYTTPTTLRSNAAINKRMLLSTEYTPAEFLTSFCKTFGLSLVVDAAMKTVQVINRNDYYFLGAGATIDLTKRIDENSISILPCAFDVRWWEFKHTSVGGSFENEYKAVQGREYGVQRVNTAYDFDASVKDVLQGVIFKSAASVLESSPCFFSFTEGINVFPTPFVYPGNKYTLWDSYGGTIEQDIPALETSVLQSAYPINQYGHEGYDNEWSWKVQLHDKDGKPLEGSGVLISYNGVDSYDGFSLTDDVAVMDTMNGGKPCWIIDYDPITSINVPSFTRFETNTQWTVLKSLDFGLPAELDIPYINYDADTTIYAKRWKAYLSDRLDKSTKVMRCKVDLRGLQVGQRLLRNFYWYDGSLWVLNKIENYSLTTWDLTECEFVQVQDKTNYSNGQN